MQNEFQFFITKIIHGVGSSKKVGDIAKKLGARKALVMHGPNVKAAGIVDPCIEALKADGITCIIYDKVEIESPMHSIEEAAALGRAEGADICVAIGGGSAIDSAKAIAYGLAEPEQDVWDLYEHTRTAKACLPIGVVLPLSATGSEMSDSSVITKEEENKKRGYNSDLCRPRFAVMNPALTMTLSDYQTACGCTDIMMHTMERYFTNGGHMEITDGIAEVLLVFFL